MQASQDALGRTFWLQSLSTQSRRSSQSSLAIRTRSSIAGFTSDFAFSSLRSNATLPRVYSTLAREQKRTHQTRRAPVYPSTARHAHFHVGCTQSKSGARTTPTARHDDSLIYTHRLDRLHTWTRHVDPIILDSKRFFASCPPHKSDDVYGADFDIPNGEAGEELLLAEVQENPSATEASNVRSAVYVNENNEYSSLIEDIERRDEEVKTRAPLDIPDDLFLGFDEFIRYEGKGWASNQRASDKSLKEMAARRRRYHQSMGTNKAWDELFQKFTQAASPPTLEQQSSITVAGLKAEIAKLFRALSNVSIPCNDPIAFGHGSFLKISGPRSFILAVLRATNHSQDFFVAHLSLSRNRKSSARILSADTFEILSELGRRKKSGMVKEEHQDDTSDNNAQQKPIEIVVQRILRKKREPRFHPKYLSNAGIALNLAIILQDMCADAKIASKDGVEMIMSFYINHRAINIARTIMLQMNQMGIPPDQKTFNLFLQAAASHYNLPDYGFVLDSMTQVGLRPNWANWESLSSAAPEKHHQQDVLCEMHNRGIFTSSTAAFDIATRVIDVSFEPFLAEGGSVENYMETLTELFGPTWLSQRALARLTSVLAGTLRYREALGVIDRFASTGIFMPRIDMYNVLLVRCQTQRNMLCGVTLALHALRKHPTTAIPNRLFFNRLFFLAWRCRKLNCLRVVWKYACAAGYLAGYMVRKFQESLRHAHRNGEPTSQVQKWNCIAAVFVRGGHVRRLTDVRKADVESRKRGGDSGARDWKDDGDEAELAALDDAEHQGDEVDAQSVVVDAAELDGQPPDGRSTSQRATRDGLDREFLVTSALHEEQEAYGTYDELRPLDQALEEALRLDYSPEWKDKAGRGPEELDWLLGNGVRIPMRRKRMQVARGMLERFRLEVEH